MREALLAYCKLDMLAMVRVLNQAVKRNTRRFPEDFTFRLNDSEKEELVTNCDQFEKLKYASVNPQAFTERGYRC